jgi:hypothetical protein
MRITLGYAKTQLAEFVGEGFSPEEPIVVVMINRATNWLLPKIKGGNIFCRYRFTINNSILTLPRECESLIKLRVNDRISNINNRWFEFMGYGSGGLDYGGGYWSDTAYLGNGFPCFADPVYPSNLIVISEEEETNKNMTIRGRDEFGKEIEETISICKKEPFYTSKKFKKIENIIKSTTNSYVVLSTFDEKTTDRINLGYYAPSETNPSYTRYFIRGDKEVLNAVGIVRLAFVPINNDNEPLLIQNLPALSLMLKSLHYYTTGDIQKGQAYEGQAIRLIEEQIENEEPQTNTIDFSKTCELCDNSDVI